MDFTISDQLSLGQRIWIVLGLAAGGLVSLLFLEPIPQDPGYHLFADTRWMLGIPNFSDVVSSAGFALVGFLGAAVVLGAKRHGRFIRPADARPYIIFFTGVALISFGSAYYHLEPGNHRLFWDRLPMSIAFMAFFSAVIADRISASIGNGWLLWILIGLGVSSLVYWNHTEMLQQGDLRFYAYVQFFPLIALPFIMWLFPGYHYMSGHYIGWIVFWYAASKLFEHFDAEIFAVFGQLVSGHTLKHLAAAVSALVVLRMLTTRGSSNPG